MAKPVFADLDFQNTNRPTNVPQATAAGHLMEYAQTLALIEGNNWKDNVRVASVANVNIAAPGATIDGITMAASDRVLLKDQTAGAENGIYIWNGAAVAMTRASDMNASLEFNNAITVVDVGTNAGTKWRQTTMGPTVGTTSITWVSDGGAAPAASETVSGIAELATQAETDAGTDDLRIVTPLKLATYSGRKLKFNSTFGDGTATSYTITHNLNTKDVTYAIRETGGSERFVDAEVRSASVNALTVLVSPAPASNSLRITVIG